MRLIIIFNLIFLISISSGQNILLSKTSLYLYAHKSDTIFVKNSGTKTLVIDTMYTLHSFYLYRVYAYTNQLSTRYLLNYMLQNNAEFDININPGDTVKLIFEAPDLCPVCKKFVSSNYFEDTLIIKSNSVVNNSIRVAAKGYGFTDIEKEVNIPSEYKLFQNFPNPFNPSTTIKYSIPAETGHAPSLQHVTLKVYDLPGREVTTLVDEERTAGNYEVRIDGSKLSSGLYFYTLRSGDFVQTKKMMLIK
jgi:hypothetical protein